VENIHLQVQEWLVGFLRIRSRNEHTTFNSAFPLIFPVCSVANPATIVDVFSRSGNQVHWQFALGACRWAVKKALRGCPFSMSRPRGGVEVGKSVTKCDRGREGGLEKCDVTFFCGSASVPSLSHKKIPPFRSR
jgi:hypothetical protein